MLIMKLPAGMVSVWACATLKTKKASRKKSFDLKDLIKIVVIQLIIYR